MGQGRVLGGLLNAVEDSPRGEFVLLKQRKERLLLLLRKSSLDGLMDTPIHQRANAPGHPLHRTKGWEFAVFFHQHFSCSTDEISRVFHHLCCSMHSLRCDMPDVLPLTLNL